METKEKTNKNVNGNEKSEMTSNISTGIGVAIGAVVGSAFASELNAAEVETPIVPPVTPDKPERQEEPVTPEPPVKPDGIGEVTPEEPEIIVEDCGFVQMADGSVVEMAALNINGHAALVVDEDLDGVADVMVMDVNGNDVFDENEVFDMSRENYDMATFREPDYTDVTHDYVNNADVEEYMA